MLALCWRRWTAVLLFLICVSFSPRLVFSQECADETKSTDPNAAQTAIEASLQQTGTWEFENVPLTDVVATLRDQMGLDIVIDARSLEEAGIGTDLPITARSAQITFRSFLRMALELNGLTIDIRDDEVWVTTSETAETRSLIRTYPISDLLRLRGQSANDDLADLISAIQITVNSESWERGGGPATVRAIHGAIAVSQSSESHSTIVELLAGLRKITARLNQGGAISNGALFLGGPSTQARDALSMPVSVDFEATTLHDILVYLRDSLKVSMAVNQHSLEDAGIGTNLSLTLKLDNQPLRKVLRRVLEPISLTYSIRNEAIIIETSDAASARMAIGIYPVYDLVGFGEDGAPDFDSLVQVITDLIDRASWRQMGGQATISSLAHPTVLIVGQTEMAHETITALLGQLRAAKALDATAKASVSKTELDTNNKRIKVYRLSGDAGATKVAELVKEMVGPERWNDSSVFIRDLGSKLVVRQSRSVHLQIEKFLAEIQEAPVPTGGGFGGDGTMMPSGGGGGLGGAMGGGGFFSLPPR